MPHNNFLLDLPHNVFDELMLFLSIWEILQIRLTSKPIQYRIDQNHRLWTALIKRDLGNYPSAQIALTQRSLPYPDNLKHIFYIQHEEIKRLYEIVQTNIKYHDLGLFISFTYEQLSILKRNTKLLFKKKLPNNLTVFKKNEKLLDDINYFLAAQTYLWSLRHFEVTNLKINQSESNRVRINFLCYTLSRVPASVIQTIAKEQSETDAKINLLNLEQCELRTWPIEWSSLVSLTTLNLSANSIADIPEHFNHLKNLSVLFLSNNHLKSFPKVILSLDKLKMLDLSNNSNLGFSNYNYILSVPAEIDQLQNLKDLNLKNVGLEHLPAEIEKLSSLTNLSIKNNQVKHLPDELFKIKDLKINISGNICLNMSPFNQKNKQLKISLLAYSSHLISHQLPFLCKKKMKKIKPDLNQQHNLVLLELPPPEPPL